MTIQHEKPESLAFSGDSAVRLAAGIKCPHCGRELRPTDILVHPSGVQLICVGCHDLVLRIERRPALGLGENTARLLP